ncbi:MAG: RNA polymerase subunit sigma-70 [Planctomycetes bacterium]|nr:RNA polymerase subunit sigma-70 [Planctomycetota bacterium]
MSEGLTRVLDRVHAGDTDAVEELFQLVYDDLHRMAGQFMARERASHTWSATDLLNEAFVRLEGKQSDWARNRRFLFAAFARAMKTRLIDHARARKADKRGGGQSAVPLDDIDVPATRDVPPDDLLTIVEFLERRRRRSGGDALDVRAFEGAFFGGFTIGELAETLGVSESTVKRELGPIRLEINQLLDPRA